MAGIDKTYVKNWNEYFEIQEWCKSVGTVTDVYGNTFKPIDYLWEYTEEVFKNSITEQINNVLERYHKGDYKKLIEEEKQIDWIEEVLSENDGELTECVDYWGIYVEHMLDRMYSEVTITEREVF